jgi:phage gp36-like protein
MSYATLQQLTDRFGERMLVALTDRAEVPTGAIDTAVVTRALTDTDALIDGYLMARYVLPLTETPPLVADLAQAIAIYKLHPYAPDPKIEADYKDALRMLQQIAAGTIRLSVAGLEPADQGGSGAMMTDRERDLTPDNMTGFI